MKPPVVLTIAGSDSGGGAGIQADLKTFQAFGAFGTTALTAVTAQNTLGVQGVHTIPPALVRLQIRSVAEDLRPVACKSGMIATAELMRAIEESIREHELGNYVLDPVMVATSGDRLLDQEAERGIVEGLLPLATLITPNLDEAEILVGFEVRDREGMRRAARLLAEAGAGVLIKGGHLPGEEVIDILLVGRKWHEWRRPRVDTTSTHGTGCTLSAAIAAGLAHGRPLRDAVENALGYVDRALRTAPRLGQGHGPLDHWAATDEVSAGLGSPRTGSRGSAPGPSERP